MGNRDCKHWEEIGVDLVVFEVAIAIARELGLGFEGFGEEVDVEDQPWTMAGMRQGSVELVGVVALLVVAAVVGGRGTNKRSDRTWQPFGTK